MTNCSLIILRCEYPKIFNMYLAIFLTCMKLLNAVLNVFQVNTNTSERGHSTLRHVTSMHLFIHDFDQAFLCLAAVF